MAKKKIKVTNNFKIQITNNTINIEPVINLGNGKVRISFSPQIKGKF